MKDSTLTDLLEPLLAQFGLELEALDVVPAGRRRVLKIIVDGDGPAGRGPTLDDIAEATKAISDHLDQTGAMGEQAYTLEVSSRGTSRPLTEPKHWRRNTGRLVKLTTEETEPVIGRIIASDDTAVTLEITRDAKKGTTSQETFDFSEIGKAIIQVELNRKSDLDEADLDDTEDDDTETEEN